MKFFQAFAALLGAVSVSACVGTEEVGRSDTADFHYSMSATMDEREVHQSLTAVSMKDMPGSALAVSDRARQIIATYGN